MNAHWLLHNRRARFPQIRASEWIELGCALSCYVLVIGFATAIWLQAYALILVSLIPAALSMLAAHFHDWSREI
jgi:hypothetical protein